MDISNTTDFKLVNYISNKKPPIIRTVIKAIKDFKLVAENNKTIKGKKGDFILRVHGLFQVIKKEVFENNYTELQEE